MSNYRGLYTFDTDNHKYVTLPQTDGIIDLLDTDDYVPTEPVIKDEKIRRAIRSWAEVNSVDSVKYEKFYYAHKFTSIQSDVIEIDFLKDESLSKLDDCKIYTIEELCGDED